MRVRSRVASDIFDYHNFSKVAGDNNADYGHGAISMYKECKHTFCAHIRCFYHYESGWHTQLGCSTAIATTTTNTTMLLSLSQV
jgi:hypothetical protein